MSKQLKGIVVWLIVLVLMVAGLSYLGEKLQTQNNYSYKELEQDLENHQVSEAVIHQNQQTPTGQLIVVLTNGRNKDMYIDDVKEVRQMLENANVSYQMTDVPKESKLLSVGVPIASLGVMVILLFMLMGCTRNNAWQTPRLVQERRPLLSWLEYLPKSHVQEPWCHG